MKLEAEVRARMKLHQEYSAFRRRWRWLPGPLRRALFAWSR